jgi:drug/metabolite transporter (DMT)-like permease
VAIALAILYTGPVIASVIAPRVLGERVRPQVYAGLGLALVGVLAVVRPGGETSAVGLAAAVFSALSLAALMLIAKPAAQAFGGLVVAAGELTIASLVLTPFAIQAVVESREFWLEFLVLGAVLTGIAGWIFWGAMQQLPVAAVSVIMYLEPASAVVWAMLFLEETPDALAWIGITLVLTGGILAGAAATRAEEEIVVPAAL